ncbi:hypothetical protein [Mesorhizobium caraganae]|uniref:hypothetical protein n=1 Tax=Mesorhizobium caraganae TaxID=483206 RepID=UPI001AEE0AD4|nr:hypothetical protein [Mesorhizobium caraganae]
MPEPRQIDILAQHEIDRFLAEEACQFLDCSIRLMAHSMPISAVIRRLQDEIAMLEEFG